MRAVCNEDQSSFSQYDLSQAPLKQGKSYIVYAILEDEDGIMFCIRDEMFSSPMYWPAKSFILSDQRLSKFWVLNFCEDRLGFRRAILAFPTWANDPYFYTKLFDGEEAARAIFHRYEKLMDLEFPDPSIVDTAQIGDNQWLICPLCIDAWESQTNDALVICPKCKTKFNNPRYKNDFPLYKALPN